MSAFGRGTLWPSSSTPADPTQTFTTSTTLAEINLEEALQCRVTVAGAAARAIELKLETYLDPDKTWVEVGRHVILGASIGVHPVTIRVPEVSTVRMSVRRWGGTVNTTVIVDAEARGMIPELTRLGQPLELAGHQADGIECWSDGSGGSASVPAGPWAHAPSPAPAADQLWIPVGCADTLVIEAEVGGLGDDWIELQVRESPDDTTTTLGAVAVDTVTDGVVDTEVASEQISGTVGTWRTREIPVRPGTALLVLAQRAGTKAATLLAHARLYRLGRGGSGAGGPGGEVAVTSAPETDVDVVSVGGDSVAQEGGRQKVVKSLRTLDGPTTCYDDSGSADALTTSFADSDSTTWLEISTDTQVIDFILTVSGTAMTALEVMPLQSPDGGTTEIPFEADDILTQGDLQTSPLYYSVHGQDGAATLPVGTYTVRILREQLLTTTTHVKLQARRSGGDATSSLLGSVVFAG